MKTERVMHQGKFAWYCQKPGKIWATDPVVGWILTYNTQIWPPSWMLSGNGVYANMETRAVKSAMKLANLWIRENAQ